MSLLSLHDAGFESRSFFLRVNNWFYLRISMNILGEEEGTKAWSLFEEMDRDICLFYDSISDDAKEKMLNYDDSVRAYRDLAPRKTPPLSIEDMDVAMPFWIKISEELNEEVCKELWPGELPCHWTHIWEKWTRSKKRAADFSFSLDEKNFETLLIWYEVEEQEEEN